MTSEILSSSTISTLGLLIVRIDASARSLRREIADARFRFIDIEMTDGHCGGRRRGEGVRQRRLEKPSHDDPRGERSGSEVDISEWSSVIYFSCLITLTTYDISKDVSPSVRRLGCHTYRTHDPRRAYVYNRGYNTRHVILPARSFPSVSLSFSLERTLLRDRRECLHLSPPAEPRFGRASHKERFIVWRPPDAR